MENTAATEKKRKIDEEVPVLVCNLCQTTFPSRNKLYKHLQTCTRQQQEQGLFTSLEALHDEMDNKYIYVTGGRLRGKTLGCVERFSLGRGVWEACPRMMENRGSHGAAASNSRLFALGGGGFDSNLATSEEFDANVGTWTAIAPMKTFRHALSVVAMNVSADFFRTKQTVIPVTDAHRQRTSSPDTSIGDVRDGVCLIFCVGGWMDGTICSGHVEAYDVATNTW